MLFPGVKASRDGFQVDVSLDRLRVRVGDRFDSNLSHEVLARRYPGVMKNFFLWASDHDKAQRLR